MWQQDIEEHADLKRSKLFYFGCLVLYNVAAGESKENLTEQRGNFPHLTPGKKGEKRVAREIREGNRVERKCSMSDVWR